MITGSRLRSQLATLKEGDARDASMIADSQMLNFLNPNRRDEETS